MRTRNRDSRPQEHVPAPANETVSDAADLGAQARSLLELGDALIERALSSDSQRFLLENRQKGGE